MQDTTVSGIRFGSDSGAQPRSIILSLDVQHANHDELLARVLITSWGLATGRTLRGGPPHSLSEDELINFWADDHIPAPRTGTG
jgi:hypothetical protein